MHSVAHFLRRESPILWSVLAGPCMFFRENVEIPPFVTPNAGSFTQKGHRIGIVSDSDNHIHQNLQEPLTLMSRLAEVSSVTSRVICVHHAGYYQD